MKKIPLTQGQFAIVDDADFEWLSQWKWHYSIGYAYSKELKELGGKTLLMHRLIMNTPKGMDVDHKDLDTLNNQRSNLRNCSRSENMANQVRVESSSGYKGVTRDRARNKWKTQLMFHGKNIFQERFDDKVDAAKAYDKAAIEYFGEFANLNFPKT